MNRRMELGNIIDNTLSIKEAKAELNKAKRDRKSLNLKLKSIEMLNYLIITKRK